MDTKNMQFKDILVFKTPFRMDWRATQAKIAKWYRDEYPELNSISRMYNIFETTEDIKKIIKKQGTFNTYKYLATKTNISITK